MAEQRAAAASTGRADAGRIMDSSDHLAQHLQDVPVLVVPCSSAGPTRPRQGMLAGFYGSILPAVWSFMLAARARGLGTALTTLHLGYEAEAAELLGIPDTVTQVALIPVAYYTGETSGRAPAARSRRSPTTTAGSSAERDRPSESAANRQRPWVMYS